MPWILTACIAHLTMPAARFATPEAQGGAGKGFAGVGIASGPSVGLVQTSAPPRSVEEFGSGAVLSAALALGVQRRWDVEAVASGAQSGLVPWIVRTKFQFYGKPGNEARRGDTSLAVTFGGGRASESSREPAASFFGSSHSTDVDTDASVIEAGLVGGQRLSDSVLAYGGVSASRYRYESRITQTFGRDRSQYQLGGRVEQVGLNGGIQLTRGAFVVRLDSFLSAATSRGVRAWQGGAGVQVGVRW